MNKSIPSARRVSSTRDAKSFALKGLVAATLAGALVAGCGSESSTDGASQKKSDSLTVSVRAVADAYMPIYWAQSKGYFKDAGLDLKIQVGGAGQIPGLVAGRADLGGISIAASFGMSNEGKKPKAVFATDLGSIAYVFSADPKVKSPDQCKTMTTAIPGTNVYAWSVLMQQIFDVKWKLTQLTDVPSMAGTVVTGRSDCGMGSLSIYQKSVAEGKLRVIFDPTKKDDLPSNWPATGIEDVWVGMDPVLKSKRSAVEKFIEVYSASVEKFKAADDKSIATTLAANKDWAGYTVEALLPNIKAIKPSLNPYNGYIPTDAWKPTLNFFHDGGLSFLDPKASKWSYDNQVDMSYYDNALGSPK